MREFFVVILCCFFFALGGCAAPRGVTPQDIEHKSADLADLSKSRIVTVVSEPYLGARAMPLPKNADLSLSGGIFSRSVTLNKRGSLAELCAAASSLTGLPIAVHGKASGNASSAPPHHRAPPWTRSYRPRSAGARVRPPDSPRRPRTPAPGPAHSGSAIPAL